MTDEDFTDLRIEYGDQPLRRADLPADPKALFRAWLADAAAADVREPNGMTLATCDAEGQPHARVVLLKQLDDRGFVFFTNRRSDKGEQLRGNVRAAATFWWPLPRNRQVRVIGVVEHVPEDESDAYFASRPRRAQLCSAASPQSQAVESRQQLERLVEDLSARIGDGAIARPAHWGGYVLRPKAIEFWQGRNGRLHDRFRFEAIDAGFRVQRLAP